MLRKAKAAVQPVRQSNQFNCMTVSMAMCLKANGVAPEDCTTALVNKVMGARPMQGASWEDALACAQHYGMKAVLTVPCSVPQLKQWTDNGFPVIIAWNPEDRPWAHASVVFDVDDAGTVFIADPNIPDPDEVVREVSKADFYKKWAEKHSNGYLIRRPALAILPEITADGRQMWASTDGLSAARIANRFLYSR